jgi:hypothetical protein
MVNLYLDDEQKGHKADIHTVAATRGAQADALLEGYAREALRLFFLCILVSVLTKRH